MCEGPRGGGLRRESSLGSPSHRNAHEVGIDKSHLVDSRRPRWTGAARGWQGHRASRDPEAVENEEISAFHPAPWDLSLQESRPRPSHMGVGRTVHDFEDLPRAIEEE